MSQQRFDVVVIGSGIGGIAAAALLAKRGFKTLVVEKLPIIGGRCSTREMKGFKLTTGVVGIEMEMDGMEMGGVIVKTFRETGADFDVRLGEGMRYRIGGQDFEMPPKAGLRALINLACGDEKEADRIYGIIRLGWRWQEPPGTLTFQEWLSQYTQNPKILGIFQALISVIIGANIWEVPAHTFIRLLSQMGGYRAFGIAPRGNLYLMESLAQVVKRAGGDVWTRSLARRILAEGNTVSGVVVEKNGQQISVACQAVISDAGPKATIELVGADQVDRAYVKLVRDTQLPAAIVWLHIASDRPLIPYTGMLLFTEARRVNVIACPTNLAPELAPKGKSLLIVGAAPRFTAPPYDFQGDLDLALLDLKDNLPGFDKAEILTVGHFHDDWPVSWTIPGREIPAKMNIENLWQVGDGVLLPGWAGSPGATYSAHLAVQDLERRLKPAA